jgi:hypothetical protein
MAEDNWYSNGNNNWNATNAWNTQADGGGTALSDPDADAHVIIQGSDTITITAAIGNTIKSLTIDSGSDLDGHASHIIETTAEGTASFGSEHYAVKINGTTDSNVNLTVGGTFDTRLDLDGTMGNLILKGSGEKEFRGTPTIGGNVTIQDSCDVACAGAVQINGNLTITSGSYDTGSNHALTVTGKTTIGNASHSSEDQATLTCNASAISLGSTKSDDYAIEMLQGGTYAGGSNNHTTGAIKQTVANTKFTFTSATTTINSEYTSQDRMFELTAGKAYNADGRITLTGNYTSAIQWNGPSGDTGPHNLRLNDANLTLRPRTALIVEGYLKIDAGTFTTSHPSSANNALTVTGKATVTGVLTLNNSTVDIGETLQAEGAGNIVCANTALTVGSLVILGTATLPSASGSCTVDSEGTGSHGTNGYAIDINGTVTHNSGTVTVTTAASTLLDLVPSSGVGLNNLTYNASGRECTGVGATTIAGDLTITAGLFTMYNNVDLTVGSLTIASGGEYIATSGTTTITKASGAPVNGRCWHVHNSAGRFVHNNGLVKFTGSSPQVEAISSGGTSTPNPFYDVEQTAGTMQWKGEHSKVLNNATIRGSQFNGSTGNLTVLGICRFTAGSFNASDTSTSDNSFFGTLIIESGATVDLSALDITVGSIRNLGGTING